MNKFLPLFVIGLTGNTGSGKSTVANFMKRLGAHVIDADTAAREVVQPGGDTLKEIVATFGTGVTNDDGSLNRKALGAIVFKDKAALSRLNKIIHPAILSNILTELKDIKDSRVSKDRQCTVVIDAPLLFEAGLQNITDQVWVVAADKNTRLKRIIRRDGLSHEQAMQRMASQMSQRDKMDKADKVIRNDGTLENTYLQVKRFWREMKMSPSGDDHNCAPPKE